MNICRILICHRLPIRIICRNRFCHLYSQIFGQRRHLIFSFRNNIFIILQIVLIHIFIIGPCVRNLFLNIRSIIRILIFFFRNIRRQIFRIIRIRIFRQLDFSLRILISFILNQRTVIFLRIHFFHLRKISTLIQYHRFELCKRLIDFITQCSIRRKCHLRITIDDYTLTSVHIYALPAFHTHQLKGTKPLYLDQFVCLKIFLNNFKNRPDKHFGIFQGDILALCQTFRQLLN